jgi:hypothetical protein
VPKFLKAVQIAISDAISAYSMGPGGIAEHTVFAGLQGDKLAREAQCGQSRRVAHVPNL